MTFPAGHNYNINLFEQDLQIFNITSNRLLNLQARFLLNSVVEPTPTQKIYRWEFNKENWCSKSVCACVHTL